LFTWIPINEDGLWGLPRDPGSDVFSFNGAMTKDVVFPLRPMEVTLSGTVEGPELMSTADDVGVGDVSVSVWCTSLTGAPNTFFSGSTETDSSGNYSLQVLSGTDCEIEFRPLLISEFPFDEGAPER
jgi:hypothetical protein